GSNFDYASQLTEVVLLGAMAIRSGRNLKWDVENMVVQNAPELSEWVKEPVRKGWSYGENLWI
ncbi:MAG: Gfo/Idh/MocA family protein, partial [Verrucomicrobiia bacterium]